MQGSQMPETNPVLTHCPHKGPQSSGYKAFIFLRVNKGSFACNMLVRASFWATSWNSIRYVYGYKCVCIYIYVYIYTHIDVCVCMYTYIRIYVFQPRLAGMGLWCTRGPHQQVEIIQKSRDCKQRLLYMKHDLPFEVNVGLLSGDTELLSLLEWGLCGKIRIRTPLLSPWVCTVCCCALRYVAVCVAV